MYATPYFLNTKEKIKIKTSQTEHPPANGQQTLFVHLRKIFFISFLFDTRLLENSIYLPPETKS